MRITPQEVLDAIESPESIRETMPPDKFPGKANRMESLVQTSCNSPFFKPLLEATVKTEMATTHLATQTNNSLMRSGIRTLDQLARFSATDLLQLIPSFGTRSLQLLQTAFPEIESLKKKEGKTNDFENSQG